MISLQTSKALPFVHDPGRTSRTLRSCQATLFLQHPGTLGILKDLCSNGDSYPYILCIIRKSIMSGVEVYELNAVVCKTDHMRRKLVN